MIVTKAWMEEWFTRFDREYFGGKLPLPEIALSRARTQLGQFSCKRAWRLGRTKLYDFRIAMSTYYDMTDRQAKSVLLHEMIHYIIAYTGLRDTSAHGVVFRGMMDKLNRQYGWEIRVSSSTRGWKVNEQVKARKEARGPETYIVLAIETHDGKHYLSRVSPSSVRRLETQMRSVREVKAHRWFTTREPYFVDFPQVRSLRGRRISKADYDRMTNVLQPIEEI